MSQIKPHTWTRTLKVRVRKDLDAFGGPNMWHVEILDSDGFEVVSQWVDVSRAERLVGHPLPRYESSKPKIKQVR